MAEAIEIPFGMWTLVDTWKHVLDCGAHWRNLANTSEPVHVRRRCGLTSNYFEHLL